MHQTIKGFYVYLLSSFYIGVQSFGKSTGPFSVYIPQGGVIGCSSSVDFSFHSVNFRLVSVKKLLKSPACFGAFRPNFWFCAKILYRIATLIDAQSAGSRPSVSMSISHHCVFFCAIIIVTFKKITCLILRNLFGLYLFSHQSCATGTLLLRK